jgi:SAM-dependent MidA family methyltransferase
MTSDGPTPLARLIAADIAATGPITLADYMARCLMHPAHGYYATRDPFGQNGDFITAPEISQMFGELVGAFLAQVWIDQGRPGRIVLAEPGPGRGTLMADILRVMARVPGLCDAADVHLVEASPHLRARQAETLTRQHPALRPTWHDRIDTLPEGPLFLVANEFFDALPIRQFRRAGGLWRETMVGLDGDRLQPRLSPPAPLAALSQRLADTAEGEIVEVCPALPVIAGDMAARIARHGGVALVIDYGGWRSRGDTFQAVAAHGYADPFAAPGEADLTAHVDFDALAAVFADAGAVASAMVPQGVFLERLGIAARAEALARHLSGANRAAHLAAHRRLTHPDAMGQLFKVIACLPPGSAPAPGLVPA